MAEKRAKIALLMLLSVALTAACPRHEHSLGNNNEKRWYGLRFWPVEDQVAADIAQPWPKDPTTGITTIRYCYNTIDDYHRLTEVVKAALDIWQPAFAVSSLQVLPHTQLQTDTYSPLCTDQTPTDVIRLYAPDDGICAATFGYFPGSATYQNEIRCDPVTADTPEEMAIALAHEFGHVFGLRHEHQRPDAAAYIEYRCNNLWDYDDHVQTIAARKAPYEDGDTIDKVCNDRETAIRYQAESVEMMPEREYDEDKVGGTRYSKTFDYASIMNYGSFAGAYGDAEPNLDEAVLVVRAPNNPGRVLELFEGGSHRDPVTGKLDYSGAGISEGDTARIAQLYPLTTGEADVAKKPEWESVQN